jgi:hypothetical protein
MYEIPNFSVPKQSYVCLTAQVIDSSLHDELAVNTLLKFCVWK